MGLLSRGKPAPASPAGEEHVDPWHLVYEGYEPEREGLREALCTLGNGYFATRGAAPDGSADGTHNPGTYLAGGYDRAVSDVAGRRIENEDLVNFPNWLPLRLRIEDDDWLRVDDVELLSYRQSLSLRDGLLVREIRFRDERGRATRWSERRFVSMANAHLAGLCVEVTPEDWSGRLLVHSALDGTVVNDGVDRYRDLESRHLDVLEAERAGDEAIALRCRTRQSRLEMVQVARTRLFHGDRQLEVDRRCERRVGWIGDDLALDVREGEPVRAEKIVALYTVRDDAISEPGVEARKAVEQAGGFDALLADHRRAWHELWEEFDVEIHCCGEQESTALKVRLHTFHLLQTASPHSIDLDAGIPARGWHGEAYRGHIFWDELFVFPLLTLRMPVLTRALLLYRYRRLPEARRTAREAGYRGAMFPWQSGSDGREESQRLHLNPDSGRWIPDDTHRQRHIGAAVVYNVWTYLQITDDHDFLYFYGAEMILEIARFWASIARYDEAIDRYDIRGVVGPDEYHTGYPHEEEARGLDNNAYTNVMAAWVLTRARDVIDLLPERQAKKICRTIGLSWSEIDAWEEISRKLRLCFHGDGILSQFEGYDALEEFDWEGYRAKYGDIHRLDRILEAEGDTPNRYKASKQADVLMLFYLFSSDELRFLFEQLGYPLDPELIPRNIDYYLERTSHGSTLSSATHSWVLARADRPRSWRLFQEALDSDIGDVQGGTTSEGIHVGAMAGTVDLLQRCYTGIEARANVLFFNPTLPGDLDRIVFRLRYRRQLLRIEVTHDELTVESLPFTAAPITIAYRGHSRELTPGDRYSFRLLKPEERERALVYGDGDRTLRRRGAPPKAGR